MAYLDMLPWPLTNCLKAVASSDELLGLAEQIGSGTFGDMDEWRALEETWQNEGIRLEDFAFRASNELGLDRSTGLLGLPMGSTASLVGDRFADSLLQEVASTAQEMESGRDRDSLIWFLFAASSLSGGGLVRVIKPIDLRRLCASSNRMFWYQNPVGYPEDSDLVDQWLDFFDWLGCTDLLSQYYYRKIGGRDSNVYDDTWGTTFQKAFLSDRPARTISALDVRTGDRRRLGLLRLLGRMASDGYSVALIPPILLDVGLFDESRFKLAAVLARLSQPFLTPLEAVKLAEETKSLLEPPAEPSAAGLLFRTASEHLKTTPAIEPFLLRLREIMPITVELGFANCERLLRLVQRTRASDLQSPDQLQRLQLPFVASD